jgi:hypothetical protein
VKKVMRMSHNLLFIFIYVHSFLLATIFFEMISDVSSKSKGCCKMVIRAYLVNIFKVLWAYNICRYIYWVHYLTMYFLFSQVVWLTWSHWGWRHQISRCWSWNRKLQHEIESLQGNTNGKFKVSILWSWITSAILLGLYRISR